MTIPPWLNPPDVAGQYARGVQLGVSISQERNRLEAENARTQMQLQINQQNTERQAALQHERLATTAAYHQQTADLEQQRLQQAAQVNAAKTHEAAAMLAEHTGFAQDLAAGLPVEQALFRHPRLASPSAAIAAHKDTLDLGSERLGLARERLDLERDKAAKEKPAKVPTMDIPLPARDKELTGPVVKGVPVDSPLIAQLMGTNTPAAFRPSQGAKKNTPFAEGALVRSKKDPNKVFRITNGEPVPVEEAQE